MNNRSDNFQFGYRIKPTNCMSKPKFIIVNLIGNPDIPFTDDYFDYIIANHILEHISDEKKALSVLQREVKQITGKILLTVPICLSLDKTVEDPTIKTAEERLKAYGQIDHVRAYGNDFPERLKAAGLNVEVFLWETELSTNDDPMIRRMAIKPDERIYVCTKKVTK